MPHELLNSSRQKSLHIPWMVYGGGRISQCEQMHSHQTQLNENSANNDLKKETHEILVQWSLRMRSEMKRSSKLKRGTPKKKCAVCTCILSALCLLQYSAPRCVFVKYHSNSFSFSYLFPSHIFLSSWFNSYQLERPDTMFVCFLLRRTFRKLIGLLNLISFPASRH